MNATSTPHPTTAPRNLAPAIRASLHAKLERLLARPIIATIRDPHHPVADGPNVFQLLQRAATALQLTATPWREDLEDGSCTIAVSIDYDNVWRDREKEVLEAVGNSVEGSLALLTEAQRQLLLRSPREFLALQPPPETLELVDFKTDPHGNRKRVVELKFAAMPQSPGNVRHLAIVPNLVQIERQLDALHRIEHATDDSALGPLRALVGLAGAAPLRRAPVLSEVDTLPDERLDEHQLDCVARAMSTPHFAVIHGPPGSGKTTVISGVIRRSVARGERVLVVSPTHVAVDNVVEKLAGQRDDALDRHRVPVRYAARKGKLSARALEYWVGSKRQNRAATIARSVESCLRRSLPIAEALFASEDAEAAGHAPLSSAIARLESVICGTPIGVLSYEPVKTAAPGSVDLLIVDEVSKMTLPEFLAIAVKARRWVLVGDPVQLPPYNNSEENGVSLEQVLDPATEIVCSVGGLLERVRPALRANERFIVVASDPARTCAAIRAHVAAVQLENVPAIATLAEPSGAGLVVCSPAESEHAAALLWRGEPVRVLVERGVALSTPSPGPLIEAPQRAPALIFESAFNVYHAQPWSLRSGQRLELVAYRNGIEKYLPHATEDVPRALLIEQIAERFAVNAVAVYDWLVGMPTCFDTSPLRDLGSLVSPEVCDEVRRFTGALKKQYRMHSSISRVPREIFYYGEALHDGRTDDGNERVQLVQVESDGRGAESSRPESDTIFKLLAALDGPSKAASERASIMLITPYREQEALLGRTLEEHRRRGALTATEIEVCTLDRCQGREADYVFISLVRSRSGPFLDMPKRWNVALTRAMKGLFIVGNVKAYLDEAHAARRDPRGNGPGRRPRMSVLARVLEAYQRGGGR